MRWSMKRTSLSAARGQICEFEVSEKGAESGAGALMVRAEGGVLAFLE